MQEENYPKLDSGRDERVTGFAIPKFLFTLSNLECEVLQNRSIASGKRHIDLKKCECDRSLLNFKRPCFVFDH